MNLLQTLWSWLTSLFGKAPALVEEDCCPEDCCEEAECCEPPPEPIIEIHVKEEPTPVVVEKVEQPAAEPIGELLKEILLSEGISETVIEKYEIVKTFEGWYAGVVDEASVRESIQDFKADHGGVIKAKLSRIQ